MNFFQKLKEAANSRKVSRSVSSSSTSSYSSVAIDAVIDTAKEMLKMPPNHEPEAERVDDMFDDSEQFQIRSLPSLPRAYSTTSAVSSDQLMNLEVVSEACSHEIIFQQDTPTSMTPQSHNPQASSRVAGKITSRRIAVYFTRSASHSKRNSLVVQQSQPSDPLPSSHSNGEISQSQPPVQPRQSPVQLRRPAQHKMKRRSAVDLEMPSKRNSLVVQQPLANAKIQPALSSSPSIIESSQPPPARKYTSKPERTLTSSTPNQPRLTQPSPARTPSPSIIESSQPPPTRKYTSKPKPDASSTIGLKGRGSRTGASAPRTIQFLVELFDQHQLVVEALKSAAKPKNGELVDRKVAMKLKVDVFIEEHKLWTNVKLHLENKYGAANYFDPRIWGKYFGRSQVSTRVKGALSVNSDFLRKTLKEKFDNGHQICFIMLGSTTRVHGVSVLHAGVLIVTKQMEKLKYYYFETMADKPENSYAPMNFILDLKLSGFENLHVIFGDQKSDADCFYQSLAFVVRVASGETQLVSSDVYPIKELSRGEAALLYRYESDGEEEDED